MSDQGLSETEARGHTGNLSILSICFAVSDSIILSHMSYPSFNVKTWMQNINLINMVSDIVKYSVWSFSENRRRKKYSK